jgi:uncharacterized coiled-coil DUF342 family protein
MDKKIIKKILNLPYNTKLHMNSKVSNILKKYQTKLSVVSDAENFYSQLDESLNQFREIKQRREEVENTLIDLINEYDFLLEDMSPVTDELQDTLNELEEKAEELGASANEFFPYYSQSIELISEWVDENASPNYFKYN